MHSPSRQTNPPHKNRPVFPGVNRSAEISRHSAVVHDRNEKSGYHDYVMKQIENRALGSPYHDWSAGGHRPISAPMHRPFPRILPQLNTSQQLLHKDPLADVTDSSVEFYEGNVTAVKMSDTQFPKALEAKGAGHSIMQPNSTIARYHTSTQVTFETGIRPRSSGNNPKLVAIAHIPTSPYPATCSRRSCHDHYFNKIAAEHILDSRKDFEVPVESQRLHSIYATYNSHHGNLNATSKFDGFRMINPSAPHMIRDPESKDTPFFIHTTRDAAFVQGLPCTRTLS